MKLKLPVFGRTAFSYSTLTFNFPWSFDYIRKLAFGSPWGNYFTPGFVQPTYGAQEYQTCTGTALSQYRVGFELRTFRSALGPTCPLYFFEQSSFLIIEYLFRLVLLMFQYCSVEYAI